MCNACHDVITTTTTLTKDCTEQRSTRRKAENIAMKQLPSVVFNIVIIFLIFISSRDIVSIEVIVDNTSLSATSVATSHLRLTPILAALNHS